MERIDFSIEVEDLKVLYVHTAQAYKNITFDKWVQECKNAYADYFRGRNNPKTFSQWVNGQILAMY